ncbi:MAG TPA: plastocyanin/azurin family copper-binding protein [Solirubrobacterales bacterium]
MRRTFAIVASLAVAGTLFIASGAAGRASETVDVGDNFFDPGRVKIHKNDKVKFNWVGTEEHDVARAKGPGRFFESGPITGTGVLYSHRFKKKGTYKIICTLHEEMRMRLEVK